MNKKITYRPISKKDQNFLCKLYASTRTEELAVLDWSEEQKAEFLKSQFETQHKDYQRNYKDATFEIILVNKEMAGRLYLLKTDEEISIVDIALLPEFRNTGIGSFILGNILKEAKDMQKSVKIYVEQYNPAMKLYKRLGFKKTDDTGVYHLMKWTSK